MDDDDLRRGRPTAHRAFDEATAILAGDALQTLAFEILADPDTDANAETRAALCAGLARAAGLAGMVGGQMLDIAAETSASPLSTEAIARLQAMKTGALIRFSVEAGARLAGAGARLSPRFPPTARRSARRSRSPTTCSTPKATRRRSASARARTPTGTRRRSSRRWDSRARVESSRRSSRRRRRRSTRRASARAATS